MGINENRTGKNLSCFCVWVLTMYPTFDILNVGYINRR